MADPFTVGMAAVGTGLSLFGGLAQAKGQSQAAEAKSQQYLVQAAIAKKNAAISRQNALWTREATEQNSAREGLSTRFQIGTQKVGQAGSGFEVDSGTAVDVRESTAKIGQQNVDLIRTEGRRKAIGQEQQAEMLDIESAYDTQAAANARKAGDISVWATLIGTAGSVADKWSKASYSFGRPSTA